MTTDRNTLIGDRVRFYRTAKGWSLATLAGMMPKPICGQQLARYETGQCRWPANLLIDMAVALAVDIRILTGLEDGKHEGKDNAEWDAERYKYLMLKLPEKARKVLYKIIDELTDFLN